MKDSAVKLLSADPTCDVEAPPAGQLSVSGAGAPSCGLLVAEQQLVLPPSPPAGGDEDVLQTQTASRTSTAREVSRYSVCLCLLFQTIIYCQTAGTLNLRHQNGRLQTCG